MNIIFQLIIFMFFISFTKTNLIVPLKYIHINASDSEIKNDFLSNLYSKNLYMNITIGSNKEVIKGILNMTQNGFFIYENAYNYNSSSSFMKNNKTESFYKRNYEEGYKSNDTICLDIINNNNKKSKIEKCINENRVSFALMKAKQKNIEINLYENYSIIGLQQNDYFDENVIPLFIHSLKVANIVDSYLFSIEYNNEDKNNDFDGYLLLGNESKISDNIEIIKYSTERKFGFPFWGINFDQVCVGINNSYDKSKDNNYQSFYHTDVEFDATLPYLVGIYEYNMYIKFNFFYDLLSEKICQYIAAPINPDYSTFVCDSKSSKFIEAMKKFPKLFFVHIYSNITFVLDKNDLFVYNPYNKSDTQIYFLVLFYNHNGQYDEITKFKLGIPFFKKYKFSFNPEDRVMNYYEKATPNKKEKDKIKINFKKIISIVIIVLLLIIFFILGILFHKNIIKLPRKKKANELDDEYEYTDKLEINKD